MPHHILFLVYSRCHTRSSWSFFISSTASSSWSSLSTSTKYDDDDDDDDDPHIYIQSFSNFFSSGFIFFLFSFYIFVSTFSFLLSLYIPFSSHVHKYIYLLFFLFCYLSSLRNGKTMCTTTLFILNKYFVFFHIFFFIFPERVSE